MRKVEGGIERGVAVVGPQYVSITQHSIRADFRRGFKSQYPEYLSRLSLWSQNSRKMTASAGAATFRGNDVLLLHHSRKAPAQPLNLKSVSTKDSIHLLT